MMVVRPKMDDCTFILCGFWVSEISIDSYHKCEWARWIGAVVRPVARRGPPRFDHYLNVAEFKLLYVTCGANPKDGWRSFVRFQRAAPNPTGIEGEEAEDHCDTN